MVPWRERGGVRDTCPLRVTGRAHPQASPPPSALPTLFPREAVFQEQGTEAWSREGTGPAPPPAGGLMLLLPLSEQEWAAVTNTHLWVPRWPAQLNAKWSQRATPRREPRGAGVRRAEGGLSKALSCGPWRTRTG